MAGHDVTVYETLCAKAVGHSIAGVIVQNIIDPKTGSTFQVLEALCVRCGMKLEDIRTKMPLKRKRGPNKPKEEVPA
jgi:hypothetical protein